MRDTAGKPADSLHLVRRLNLFFQPAPRFFGSISFGDLVAKDLVGPRKRGRARLDALFELLIGTAEFLLEPLAIGDVADVQQQCRLSEILNAARADPYRNGPSVRCETPSFEFARCRRLRCDEIGAPLLGNEFCDVFTDEILTSRSVQCRGGGIAVEDVTHQIFDKNRIR